MRHRLPALALFAFAFLAPLAVAAESPAASTPIAPEKAAAIRKLLDITGAANLGVQVMDQMMASFEQQIPGVPSDFWVAFRRQIDPNEMTELIVPIYDRYFTTEELAGIIAFYETPLGLKVVSTLPDIMRESMSAGQAWGMKLAERALAEAEAAKAKEDEEGETPE